MCKGLTQRFFSLLFMETYEPTLSDRPLQCFVRSGVFVCDGETVCVLLEIGLAILPCSVLPPFFVSILHGAKRTNRANNVNAP